MFLYVKDSLEMQLAKMKTPLSCLPLYSRFISPRFMCFATRILRMCATYIVCKQWAKLSYSTRAVNMTLASAKTGRETMGARLDSL